MSEKNVWLITGAGRGLGVDIARAALTAGHAVVAAGDVWTSQTVDHSWENAAVRLTHERGPMRLAAPNS